MIGLERHIEILLLSNDCVIVPDFGGFMTHHVDARFDADDNSFVPPMRTLGFNPQLKMNDSLLAQSYVEAYDISYPEAIKRIESDVEELRQHLENEGEYEMSDIGTIYKNVDGKYEFTPCEAGILTPEFYGLSAYEMTPLSGALLKNNEESVKLKPEGKASPIQEEQTAKAEEEGAKVLPIMVEGDGERRISISVSMLRNLAAACIAVIAFLLFPSTLGNQDRANVYHSHIDTELLQKLMPKDITVGKPDLASANIALPEEQVEKQSESAEKAPAEEQAKPAEMPQAPSFCIVLASHVSMKNANAFVEQLHGKGFAEARVLVSKKSSTKVVFGSYKSEAEARQALNGLNNDKDFAEGWIMELKP